MAIDAKVTAREWALQVSLSILLLAGMYECWRQSYASLLAGQATLAAVKAANDLVPGRADLLRDLAFLEPANAAHYLRLAAERNPADATSWIQLGLVFESEGRFSDAQTALLEATRRDAGFRPAWILCNFFFRRNDDEAFWRWAQAAASHDGAELGGLIDLAWRRDPRAGRLLSVLPPNCGTRSELMKFLLEERNLGDALPVARELASCPDDQSRDLLLAYVDHAALGEVPEAAQEIWDRLSENGRIPFYPVGHNGNLITNGDFDRLPTRRGFDWHYDPVKGVSFLLASRFPRLRIEFDGREPVATPILWQPVILEKGRDYELSFTGEANRQMDRLGLHWRLAGVGNGGGAIVPDSPDWMELHTSSDRRVWNFRSPSASVSLLVLYYDRPNGQNNIRGAVSLGSIRLRRN